MSKIFNKRNILLMLVPILSLLFIPSTSMAQASKAAIDGSFITQGLCGFWTDARWQQEFTALKAAGMHYVIIQAVADSYPGRVTETLYPSSLPNTKMAKDRNGKRYPDIVDACLRNAELAGIKVFIGIDMSDNWWKVYGNDTTWLYNQMDLDNNICDELWNNYKDKYPDAFYGWYWSYEVDNVNWAKQSQQEVLIKAMNMQLDHLVSTNEKLPFMWCPFMNSRLGEPPAYEAMWKFVFARLHTTKGDIFCPQDCVGAGGLKLNQVHSWFSALRRAVDTKPGLVMWSDVETFQGPGTNFTSAPIGRVVSQLKIEQQYVDNYVTWEYCYYDSPLNTDSGYQVTYLDYLKTGSVETTPPSTPSNFTAVLQGNGNVALNWGASTDNIGICGYEVYRNGQMVFRNQVPKEGRHKDNHFSLTKLTDVYLLPETTYKYQVKAYDFAGNLSFPTPVVSVKINKILNLPNNLSKGCSYTVSAMDYTTPSGVKSKKLTDGIFSDSASAKDPKWEGFRGTNQKPIDVVIDLGKTSAVQEFIADYLLDPQALIDLPRAVKVLVSTDSLSFENVWNFPHPNVPYEPTAGIYRYRYTLRIPVEARYVDFRIIPGARWYQELTYIDELEVRSGNDNTK